MIIYGILTENSIAKLFVGGIVPGIIVSLSYILMIGLRCMKKPALGPPGEKVNIREKLKTLRDIWELFVLGAVSIGGLLIGIFTSTEAGAVGHWGVSLGNREAEPHVGEDQGGCPRDNEDIRYDLRRPDRCNPF